MIRPTEHPEVTIVVPAYNEEATIAQTVRELNGIYPAYEILVIDDGSADKTASLAESEGALVIRNRVNRGYGAALKQGIRKARGRIVAFIDADGQHDARDIGRLLEHLRESDMVIGERTGKRTTLLRRPGKWLLTFVAQFLVEQRIPDINSGLRAFHRKDVLGYFSILPNGFSLTTTLTLAMMKDGLHVTFVPIQIRERGGGRSTVKFFRDGAKTLLLILRAVMLFNPLKIFVPLSGALFLFGAVYTITTLLLETNISDSGLLLILSAFGSLALGLLADQIANIRRRG